MTPVSFDGRSLDSSCYQDQALFDLEMERVFRASWVYVGHETDVGQVGDFATVEIGTTPCILVRADDGSLQVLRNRCPHRGTTVCQVPNGNVKRFRCQYHGWTFDTRGRTVGVTFPEAYSQDALSAKNLMPLPKVESYRGFVFASFNPMVPSLSDHLGPAAGYLDRYVDHCGQRALRTTPDAHMSTYPGNWKLQMENGVDGYHANFTHASFFDIMAKRTGKRSRYITASGGGETFDLGNGHVVLDQSQVASSALLDRLMTLPGYADAQKGVDGLDSPEVNRLLAAIPGPGFNLAIYPNLQLIGIQVREIVPLSVTSTLVRVRPLLLAEGPAVINRIRLRYHEMFYGPAGFGQPDDFEMFARISAGLAGNCRDRTWFDRGVKESNPAPDDGIRPPEKGQLTDELPQRGQYREWLRRMSNSPATEDGAMA
jgi:nitrite reductase/ring-hydroxylating ferredoxin subunit